MSAQTPTANFSITAASHSRSNKHCEHCNRNGHTIAECRTLKFHCKYCDRRGHTEERCKIKNGTWVPTDTRNQGSRHHQSKQQHQRNINSRGFFPTAHAADASPAHGFQSNGSKATTQPASQSNPLHGFSAEQLQQLAQAVSMMSSTHSSGNSNTYANATGGIVDVSLAQTGEGIAECELLKWFVQEGDQVEEFQQLCEVQSDKATIEITSRYKGKVFQILHTPGDIIKVGETLLRMHVEESQASTQQIQTDEVMESIKSIDSELSTQKIGGVLSTPPVRDLAKQYNININDVLGTGKDGRVSKEDVIKYAVQKGIIEDSSSSNVRIDQALGGEESYSQVSPGVRWNYEDKTIPLRGFQRKMVQSMSMAAKVPHFHYVEEIKCDGLMELKDSFQNNNSDANVKYTFLPILIKSLSMALSKYPSVNSCFSEEPLEIVLKGSHNIGIAMATAHGLAVPNIKNVQSLSIFEITKELSRLQKLALDNKLNPGDISGGTITLSNIGSIGGKYGSPLLNLPEVAIIAIGKIQKVPQFADDGNVHPVSVMTVNIGADHRVLDGATVARFCSEWKTIIENPELLMLHLR